MAKRLLVRGIARIPSVVLFAAGLTIAAGAIAAGEFAGPNLFGAWASTSVTFDDGTNPLLLSSSMSGPPEQPGPNGLISASSDSGPIAVEAGSGSVTSFAHVGYLGGIATMSGCVLGLFQQPCGSAAATSEYFDQFHLTGAPDGTRVAVTFTLSTNGFLNGFGSHSLQSLASDGFNAVNFTSVDNPTGFVDHLITDSRSWTGTYLVGVEYPLLGHLTLSAGQSNCWGGSDFCGVVRSITVSVAGNPPLSSSLSATLVTPNPSIQLVAASGYPYLVRPVVSVKGDVNGDGVVNCADLQLVKAAFNSKRGQPAYSAAADLNGDGLINIVDLSTVARALPAGTSCN